MNPLDRNANRTRRHAAAFTLIEVMIAAAIIAILTAVAYPSYQEQIRKSRRAEAKAALLKTMQEQEKHYTQVNRYRAFDTRSKLDRTPFRAFSGETAASSAYSITAAACGTGAGQGIDACVRLTAKPGGGIAFADARCGELGLTSSGVKTATGKAGSACWR